LGARRGYIALHLKRSRGGEPYPEGKGLCIDCKPLLKFAQKGRGGERKPKHLTTDRAFREDLASP